MTAGGIDGILVEGRRAWNHSGFDVPQQSSFSEFRETYSVLSPQSRPVVVSVLISTATSRKPASSLGNFGDIHMLYRTASFPYCTCDAEQTVLGAVAFYLWKKASSGLSSCSKEATSVDQEWTYYPWNQDVGIRAEQIGFCGTSLSKCRLLQM